MSSVSSRNKTCLALVRGVVRAWKFVMRLLTRQGELERAIRRAIVHDRSGYSADLVKTIATSLARSTQLASLKHDVFGKKPFAVGKLSCYIAEKKGMRDETVISILTWCLKVRED